MTGTLDGVNRLVTVSELQHEMQPVYEAYSRGALAAGSLTIQFRGREVEFRWNGLSKRIVDEQIGTLLCL